MFGVNNILLRTLETKILSDQPEYKWPQCVNQNLRELKPDIMVTVSDQLR